MKNSSFDILGISDNATKQDVRDAYTQLKEKYADERFMEGEVGANAARKLSELEVAYRDCNDILDSRVVIEETGTQYGKITDSIKKGKINDAQDMLDRIEMRDAEWHYYQSVVYHKRDWVMESKKQLEIACSLDPFNTKYSNALERMNQTAGNNTSNANPNMNETRGGYVPPQQHAPRSQASCCDGCCALLCCDNCCECMGGDLLSCC